jgi:hypothetical protein
MNNFEIEVGSLPDRENLVSEVYYEDLQFAEISQETSDLIIQLYALFYNYLSEYFTKLVILSNFCLIVSRFTEPSFKKEIACFWKSPLSESSDSPTAVEYFNGIIIK